MFKLEEKKLAYLDKDFNKVIVSDIRIKGVYFNYYSLFFSKLKLYKNIKSKCIREVLVLIFLQLFLSISIIILKVMYAFLESSFGFKSCIYIIVVIILTPEYLP